MIRRVALLALAALTAGGILVSVSSAQVAPPQPSLNGPPTWSNDTSATFTFSSDGAASFVCSLDSPGQDPCDSPRTYPGLSEGQHQFQVVALDSEGNGSAPATHNWTIDTTPPNAPDNDITEEATSSAGAIVTFPGATDTLDPSPNLSCNHPSGSTFGIGQTEVSCTATDAAGNSDSSSFTVTVTDSAGPTLDPHIDVIVGQQSAAGAVVNYTPPQAHDIGDPSPDVDCDPPPGSTFPIGTTQVTCVATDNQGHTSNQVVFNVIVQQGAIPGVPTLTSNRPALTSSASISFDLDFNPEHTADCALDGPLGPGTFTPCSDPQTYSDLTDGEYLFSLRVTNSVGNVNQATYRWNVDLTRPEGVARFRARTGPSVVKLFWTKPIDLDYFRVRIWRKRATGGDWKRIATRQGGASFADRKVQNHIRYLYRIRSFDLARNRSAAAQLSAWPSPITRPRFDSIVHAPPLVDWRPVRDAKYYNFQVWRDGRKLLSAWPSPSKFKLRSVWRFNGVQHTLAGGRVTVYVWAGFGKRKAANYGPLLGKTRFTLG